MIHYSVKPIDRIFAKGYGFYSFTKNMVKSMGKIMGKNISRILSGKYSKKSLDHAKQFVSDAFKTASKRAIQKAAEATGDVIHNKIAEKITKISKTSQQNNLETATNEHNKEKPKERYIYPEERQKIIDDLRLIEKYHNEI